MCNGDIEKLTDSLQIVITHVDEDYNNIGSEDAQNGCFICRNWHMMAIDRKHGHPP